MRFSNVYEQSGFKIALCKSLKKIYLQAHL